MGDRTADAFRIVAKLETYEAHLSALRTDWQDVSMWRRASRQIKELVATSQSLPQLSADVLDLARRHIDLLSALTGQGSPSPPVQQVAEMDEAIDALHRKCLALVKH